ncbi:hypothetical protein [Polaromonas sp.]|uniref:hypothetical protein n=1 Tax=Polaromonas sp. TaxID=1869339 RepID=UPI0027305199|nr:hypothetical protein [Polaromonas sp.]MDP1886622.1 hypothetical protein [Polaromonas sp.]
MPEQIYDKEQLRERVLEQLRQRGKHQTTLQVSTEIGVQYWAVEQALEDAYQAREVTFAAGWGWLAQEPASKARRPASDDAQTPLEV